MSSLSNSSDCSSTNTKKRTKKQTKSTKNNVKTSEYKQHRNDIYTLLYYSNKPFVITELNLQFKHIPKSQIEQILIDLTQKQLINTKLNGKTKLYFLNQEVLNYHNEQFDQIEINNDDKFNITSKKTLKQLEEIHANVATKLAEYKLQNEQLHEKIDKSKNELSNEELTKCISEFKNFINDNKKYSNIITIDKNLFETKQSKVIEYKKIEKQRQIMFKFIVNTVCENFELKIKELLDEAGIDQ